MVTLDPRQRTGPDAEVGPQRIRGRPWQHAPRSPRQTARTAARLRPHSSVPRHVRRRGACRLGKFLEYPAPHGPHLLELRVETVELAHPTDERRMRQQRRRVLWSIQDFAGGYT